MWLTICTAVGPVRRTWLAIASARVSAVRRKLATGGGTAFATSAMVSSAIEPTPEGIAALLKRMDETEPGWLSPEDEAAWKAALQEQKEYDKAGSPDHAEKLRRMWE